jgi:hypothetical protein
MENRTQFLTALGLISAICTWFVRSRAAKWQSETGAMVEDIRRAAAEQRETVSFRDFDALPAPVAAYFRFALKNGQTRIRTATIRHTGQFCLNNKWIPFASIQHFSARPDSTKSQPYESK